MVGEGTAPTAKCLTPEPFVCGIKFIPNLISQKRDGKHQIAAFTQVTHFNPLNARCSLKIHTYLNKPAVLCKYVRPFSGHQALKVLVLRFSI